MFIDQAIHVVHNPAIFVIMFPSDTCAHANLRDQDTLVIYKPLFPNITKQAGAATRSPEHTIESSESEDEELSSMLTVLSSNVK